MNLNKDSLEKLKALNFKGFETAKNKDWDDVKALNINLLSKTMSFRHKTIIGIALIETVLLASSYGKACPF